MNKRESRLPVALPNPIKEALERKKQQTGYSKNTLIVMALEKFLGPPRQINKTED